ncbi:hypothetical protein EYF80_011889 [Liparis tanakae]|uniref:Uncharacterized protein n=1 Tax=Liparis tanakae TaxID=230148 RepID=A0A4Z2IKS3_9TELE|nr:hypothetical protein EYF80_011889 [Liparis tanakae]
MSSPASTKTPSTNRGTREKLCWVHCLPSSKLTLCIGTVEFGLVAFYPRGEHGEDLRLIPTDACIHTGNIMRDAEEGGGGRMPPRSGGLQRCDTRPRKLLPRLICSMILATA